MLKLLIADPSDAFTDALRAVLEHDFNLTICHDGDTALELLVSYQPDVLVLNFSLPFQDGLTVLQKSAHKPKIILAVTPYLNPYIEQSAANLGVQYIMIMPKVEALRVRLMDMIVSVAPPKEDLPGQVAIHLHTLNFHTHLDGYRQLCIGVPIFAKNPHMLMSKDLYPAIAKCLHLPDPRTVEHSIRKAIHDAWEQKDPLVWQKYFPPKPSGAMPCPTNKVFLSRIAEMLDMHQQEHL